jgi:hypothetical protein
VPRDQSVGVDAGSKFVRRVTAHSREGSSREDMGLKRVSSKALRSLRLVVAWRCCMSRHTMSKRSSLVLRRALALQMFLYTRVVACPHS